MSATVHLVPSLGGTTPCCGRTFFELPRDDRATAIAERVTCRGTQTHPAAPLQRLTTAHERAAGWTSPDEQYAALVGESFLAEDAAREAWAAGEFIEGGRLLIAAGVLAGLASEVGQ